MGEKSNLHLMTITSFARRSDRRCVALQELQLTVRQLTVVYLRTTRKSGHSTHRRARWVVVPGRRFGPSRVVHGRAKDVVFRRGRGSHPGDGSSVHRRRGYRPVRRVSLRSRGWRRTTRAAARGRRTGMRGWEVTTPHTRAGTTAVNSAAAHTGFRPAGGQFSGKHLVVSASDRGVGRRGAHHSPNSSWDPHHGERAPTVVRHSPPRRSRTPCVLSDKIYGTRVLFRPQKGVTPLDGTPRGRVDLGFRGNWLRELTGRDASRC